MSVEGVATAGPVVAAAAQADAAASLQALHRTVLELAAPLGADPAAIRVRFGRLVSEAACALHATSGALVLRREPAWDALLLGGGDGPHDQHLPVVDADGRANRWEGRPDGPTAHVLRTGEALYVSDTEAPSPYGPFTNRLGEKVRAFATTPLRLAGEVLGVLSVDFSEVREVSGAERDLLDLFAAHGAALADRARRLYAERRRAEQQQRLTATLAALAAATELAEALSTLARDAVALLGGVQGTARLYTEPVPAPAPSNGTAVGGDGLSAANTAATTAAQTDQALRVIVQPGGAVEIRRRARPLRSGSFAAALHEGAPATLVEDVWALDPAVYPHADSVRSEGVRSSVNVPIELGGRRIGSLHVDHPQPAFFSHSDLMLVQALAAHAGAAIERIRTQEDRAAAAASQARLDGALLVARTVAHEINNAISPVLGFAELLALRPSVKEDASATAFTVHIAEAARETASKIRRLQQIVRLERAESPLDETMPVLDLERSSAANEMPGFPADGPTQTPANSQPSSGAGAGP